MWHLLLSFAQGRGTSLIPEMSLSDGRNQITNEEIYHIHKQKHSILLRCQFFLIYRFNAIPIKVEASKLENIEKLTLKFIWIGKRTSIVKHNIEEEQNWRTDTNQLPDLL